MTRYINKENLESVFAYAPVYDGDQVADELPLLLKRLEVGDDEIVAVFKRKERTRKLRVLAFEEWTNGKFLRCVANFNHESNKRSYQPRESLNSVDDLVFIYGTLAHLFPEKDDFRIVDPEAPDGWAWGPVVDD